MRRWVLIVVLMLVASSLACAADLETLGEQVWPHPYDPASLPVAQAILEQYPLNEQTPTIKVPVCRTVDLYGLVVDKVACDLLAQQKPLDALALCDKYLEVFPNPNDYGQGCWFPTRACELVAEVAAGAKLPADQALARAQTLSKWVSEGRWLSPNNTALLEYMFTLYQEGGQKDEVQKFLEDLPYVRPDIVEQKTYWKTVVEMYMAAGETDKAQQAAVMGYRLTPIVADPGQDEALQQLLRTLVVTEGKAGVVALLEYLKTGQGGGPLTAALSPLPMTAEQRQQQEEAVGGIWARSVDAYLLNGQYAEALHAAQVETVNEGANATAGVTDIARCFKAKDLCCVRANQYLQWVTTGQGTNPVSSF